MGKAAVTAMEVHMRKLKRIGFTGQCAAWACAMWFVATVVARAEGSAPGMTGQGMPATAAAATRVQEPLRPQAGLEALAEKGGEKKAPDVQVGINSLKRVHAFVSGKVQGVGFRNFTTAKAIALKLTGWVKNLKDGRVELVAEGPALQLEQLMQAVSKGPSGARVDGVERKDEPYAGEFKGFEAER